MKKTICKRCGEQIDKSDAQERFIVFTKTGIVDRGEKYKERGYLCPRCVLLFDRFLVDYNIKENLKLVRVEYGEKNIPEEDREYRVDGKGPVGTIAEYKKQFPKRIFVIADEGSE